MQRKQAIVAGLLAGTAAIGLAVYSQLPTTTGDQVAVAGQATGTDVETLLSRLGESESEVSRLRTVLAERDARIAELTATLGERDTLIASLQAEAAELAGGGELPALLAERDARIAALTAELAGRTAEIGRIRSEMETLLGSAELAITERSGRIDALNTTIAERDAAIAALQAEAEALRADGGDLAPVLAERDGRIEQLAATLADRETQIGALLDQVNTLRGGEVALAEREARISELTAAVAEREVAGRALEGELGALRDGGDPARALALQDEATGRRVAELTAQLAERDAQILRLEGHVETLRHGNDLAPVLAAADSADKPILIFRDEPAAEAVRIGAILDALKLGPDAAVPVATPIALRVVSPVPTPDRTSALAEVHFEIGSARLSPGAQARAAAAVVVLADMPVTRIRLVGFADRTGSPALNQRLAEERAAAVAAFLVANGLSPDVIETAGVIDAADLPVETGPGVAEPLNRSVAIVPLPAPTS